MLLATDRLLSVLEEKLILLTSAPPHPCHTPDPCICLPACRYDDLKSAQDNMDLQSTILSRFDLIFIVKDPASEERDNAIARKVKGGREGGAWRGRGGHRGAKGQCGGQVREGSGVKDNWRQVDRQLGESVGGQKGPGGGQE